MVDLELDHLEDDEGFDYWADINPGRSVWDAVGSRDPDGHNRELQRAHQLLWSKTLPNEQCMNLECLPRNQLSWKDFRLASDSISNSYMTNRRLRHIVEESRVYAESLFKAGCRIGAFILFPSYRIGRKNTINGARGMHIKIADRMDLTLEAIRRHYCGETSPLSTVLQRYSDFFDLFCTFQEYVEFWMLNDIVDDRYKIRFYLPFDNFERNAAPHTVEEYQQLAESTIEFLQARTGRIAMHAPRPI